MYKDIHYSILFYFIFKDVVMTYEIDFTSF